MTIDPFYVMQYPVTKGLYNAVMLDQELPPEEANLPMTEVSRIDSIVFCNRPKRYGNYRIFRGGSWAEAANNCGSTARRKSMPDFKIDDLGFRIALTAR